MIDPVITDFPVRCLSVCFQFSPVSRAPLLSPALLSDGCGLDETLECFLRSAIRNSSKQFRLRLEGGNKKSLQIRNFHENFMCSNGTNIFDDQRVACDSLHRLE